MKKVLSQLVSRLATLKGSQSGSAFAAQCEIAQPMMDRYLKGENAPSSEKLMQICVKTGCSADWLLGLSDVRGGDAASSVPPETAEKLAALEKENAELRGEVSALKYAVSCALKGGGERVPASASRPRTA